MQAVCFGGHLSFRGKVKRKVKGLLHDSRWFENVLDVCGRSSMVREGSWEDPRIQQDAWYIIKAIWLKISFNYYMIYLIWWASMITPSIIISMILLSSCHAIIINKQSFYIIQDSRPSCVSIGFDRAAENNTLLSSYYELNHHSNTI